eukprot:11296612-Ditylum_brightwellii.AAC.1
MALVASFGEVVQFEMSPGFGVRIPDNGVTGISVGLAVGLLVALVPFVVGSSGFLEVSVSEIRVLFKKQSVKFENDCDVWWKLVC